MVLSCQYHDSPSRNRTKTEQKPNPNITPMIYKEVFQKIRQIQIRSSHKVDELLAGSWNSAFKGRGIEFEEVRPYQPGDDVRTIDWNVTARSNLSLIHI